jgi:hypothetical protein
MDKNKIKSFVETIFDNMAGAMTAGMGHIGIKPGLLKTLQGQGAMPIELMAQAADLQDNRQYSRPFPTLLAINPWLRSKRERG